MPFAQFPERPGHCFDHHIVTVLDKHAANPDRSIHVASAFLGTSAHRNRAHQCCPPPPTITRASPGMDRPISEIALAPGGAGNVAREAIHLSPTLHSPAKPDNVLWCECIEGALVMRDDLISDQTLPKSDLHQVLRQGDDIVPRRVLKPFGPLLPGSMERLSVLPRHGIEAGTYIFNRSLHLKTIARCRSSVVVQ